MKLTWSETECSIFGPTLVLEGLRDGESGCARKHGQKGRYIAMAFIGGRYLSHCAGTRQAAVTRLEREIDKRSIGLFGDDTVTFVK
jgi:hypothetical protein